MKISAQCWRSAAEEEGSGTERIGRNAGTQIVPAERHGGGQKRDKGGVEHRSKCGAGWYEPNFMCDMQCRKEGFKFYDIASIMVEDDGEPHTINHCTNCYNLRQEERKEPTVNGKRWRIMVGEKTSRDKLSAWAQRDSKTRCGSATQPKI